MKLRKFPLLSALLGCVAVGSLALPTWALEPPAVEDSENFEVLTRGPVHEAFAESVSYDPEAGLIISTAPPEDIEELPPEQELEGDNVAWIPGYWAWDEDENDFLWISGIWRNLPPEREWIPGYWNEVNDGRYQWVSGYWSDAETEEVEYVSTAPPESIDAGPNIAAPSEDHSWIPGNWYWSSNRYLWRPGYWLALRDDWNWVPSRYCWTPRGYVYVNGYWDYAVARRGVLFAPVHFRRHVYGRPGFHYTPQIVVGLNVFADHLFVRPRFRHYYFGDYYAPRYQNAGFYASYAWATRRHCYDPIYAHQRWHHRHDRLWHQKRVNNFNYFRSHVDARPAHRWAAMRKLKALQNNDRARSTRFASTLNGFAKKPGPGQRFRKINNDQRNQFVARSKDIRKFAKQRRKIESNRAVIGNAKSKRDTVVREKMSRSPLVGRRGKQLAGKNAPPQRPQARRSSPRAKGNNDKTLPNGVTRGTRTNPNTGKGPKVDRPAKKLTPTDRTQRPGRAQAPEKPSKAEKAERPNRKPQVTPRKEKATPKREMKPNRPEVRETPRQKRQVQPQRKATPPQKAQPKKRQAQPQQPKVRQQPQRKAQPQQPKVRQQPQRKAQPQQPKVRQQPQRKAQPQQPKVRQQPQRRAQPQQPKVRQQPQRRAQPQQPKVRQQPQRRAQPQRQRQAQPQRERERGKRGQ